MVTIIVLMFEDFNVQCKIVLGGVKCDLELAYWWGKFAELLHNCDWCALDGKYNWPIFSYAAILCYIVNDIISEVTTRWYRCVIKLLLPQAHQQ